MTTKTFKTKVNITIGIPQVPNFLFREGDRSKSFSVAEVSNDDLKKLGEAWTEELIANAERKRKDLKRGTKEMT